jgi:hypothetical protein
MVDGGWQKPVLLSTFCFLLWVALASDQKPANNTIKDFRAPLEYFDPPHELQMKSFLEGAEAEPGANGLVLLRSAKLQTFHEDGTREMIVKSPECIFDSRQQTVSSAGPLQVQTPDDKFTLEGQGFFWQRSNSDLTISNRVHTTIRGTMTNLFAQ